MNKNVKRNENELPTITAGEAVKLFSALDPNTLVTNVAPGEFMYTDQPKENDECCGDCKCHSNNDDKILNLIDNCDARKEFPYGMNADEYSDYIDSEVKDYDSGDFEYDAVRMDCDILNYIDRATKELKDNVKNYIDCKNIRTNIEFARVVGPDKL